ncbi:MAG TPA: S8 family serine peptidase [Chloroflexia bacterium]|nr:S8 family serine peptidase [Chloroflexia bacterium]
MRRISFWVGLFVLFLLAGVGPWWGVAPGRSVALAGAPASLPASLPAGQQAADNPALNGVPLRENWWVGRPGIDTATKLSYMLKEQFQRQGADATLGYMVYMKAQADTSNDIADWNAKGEYVLRQLEAVRFATQPALMQQIDAAQAAGNIQRAKGYTIVNAVFVRGNLQAATELAARDDVAYVVEETRYELHGNPAAETAALAQQLQAEAPAVVEPGVARVHAPQVWAMGYRGDGLVLGSIDTGVDYTHPAVNAQYRGNLGGGSYEHNYNWWDAREDAPRQNVPYDDDGHGTHTTGTVLGDDGDPGTNQIGVAPHAEWIAAKVFPNGGSSGNEEITEAEDFMLAPWDLNQQNRDPSKRPHVINNSWGDSECWNSDSWLITQAWLDAGIFPVFSNGNSGPAVGTVGTPGGYPFLIGTGAISTATDTIASFSSRGPSCWDGGIKPDVVAPGVSVRSSIPGGGYANYSGTSMAAPHVSGVLLLLLDAQPNLNYADAMSILKRTTFWGAAWGTRPNNVYGYGLVQADAAVDMALHGARVHGDVTTGSTPLDDAQVVAVRVADSQAFTATTNATGAYSMTLLAGTYDITASKFPYNPQTLTGQVIVSDTNPTINFNLTPMTTYPVSGQLYENGSCDPIAGTVAIGAPANMTVTTDAAGMYSVMLPPGTYTLTARASAIGYRPAVDTVTVGSSGQIKNFTLGVAHDATYVVDKPAFNWIAGDTQITFSDGEDGYAAVSLPFPVQFYTGTYSTINVSTNGYATFMDFTYSRMWVNTWIPNPGPTSDSTSYRYPNNALYPYWDDLSAEPRTYGMAYYGVTGSAPNRTFVIEWRGIGGGGAPMSFAIQLEETTNRITFAYQDVDAPYGNGYSATVGIEDHNGTQGIELAFNNPGILQSGTSVRFTPGTPPAIVPCGEPTPTVEATATPTVMATATSPVVPTATPTACTLTFADVPPTNTFYPFVRCLACQGIISGYPCGGAGEPCNTNDDPYFRPNAYVTRGQLAKIVSESAGFDEEIPPSTWTFTDVPYGSTFWVWVERLADREVMAGYPCGIDPNEPCDDQNRPYFRPNSGATRGQLTKIVSNAAAFSDAVPEAQQTFTDVPPTHTFWLFVERLLMNRPEVMSGYTCGGEGEPCDTENRPYFRPNNPLTRGQTSKIVANTFFPNCNPPRP